MFITATYRPISFKDPTGLEPEKEKGGEDEMLFAEIQTDNTTFFAIQSQILLEHEIGVQKQIAMKHMYEAIVNEALAKFWYGQYRFDIGGGGGGSGARGGVSSENGNEGRKLKTPKKWTAEGIADVTKDLNEELLQRTKETGKEWGYFLVWNKKEKELWAEMISKGSNDSWYSFLSNPNNFSVDDGSLLIGFVHSHTNWIENTGIYDIQFSGGDIRAFYSIMQGEYNWMGESQKSPYYFMGVITQNQSQFMFSKDPNYTRKKLYNNIFSNEGLIHSNILSVRNWRKFFINFMKIKP